MESTATVNSVGLSGIGTFTQTGGTNNVNQQGSIVVGQYSGSIGTYNLSGGQLSVGFSNSNPGNEVIGYSGSGSFIQSGGTQTVSSDLYIALEEGSTGFYNLSGGLLLSGTVYVGNIGRATFTQSGGTNNTNDLYVSGFFGGGGTYNLSGGLLSKSVESVAGAFTQSGGTNNATSLDVSGGTASYNLSGGLLIAGTGAVEYVGYKDAGTFTQSGGTNSVPTIYLGYQFSGGTYSLNSGLLITAAVSNPSFAGVFNFGGGTLQASGPLSTNSPMILTGDDCDATVDTAGYAVVFSGPLSGNGGLIKTDSGVLILSGSNSYSGGTYVTAGTLELLGGSALASGTSLIVGAEASAILSGAMAPQAATAVPEPGTLVLLAVAGLFAIRNQRRAIQRAKNQTAIPVGTSEATPRTATNSIKSPKADMPPDASAPVSLMQAIRKATAALAKSTAAA